MRMQWTEELDTGIAEIDVQNRRLGDFINTLSAAQQTGDREQTGWVLEQLLDFAVNNFLFEEKLMEEANYEFRSAHERVHEIFVKKLADFRGRYAKGDDVTEELLAMLTSWVANHIKQEDKRYAATVQQVIAQEGGETWVKGLMKKLFG
ncbi:bacteriohemerythrin [Sulfurivermis fontis]|uniref:bacteriohemerythrin n=1 Tax=Sulfurivermis fontis TaxID=1972068 RepID=UPI000FD8E8EC|nr:bacteriohemerythrin [Sulfurivermis fontis]